MHLFLAILASVVCASANVPTVKPTNVLAGQLTPISLTFDGPFSCEVGEIPFLRLKLVSEAIKDGAYIIPNDATYNSSLVKLLPTRNETRFSAIAYFRIGGVTNFDTTFLYYDPSEKSGSHVNVDVYCGINPISPYRLPEQKSQLVKESLLNLTVSIPPTKPAALSPNVVKQNQLTTITFSSSWPHKCQKVFPVIKLIIDSKSVAAGAALSSDPIPGYTIYGRRKSIETQITGVKDINAVKSENYDTLIFRKEERPIYNQAFFNFKFLSQPVPTATVHTAHFDVVFTCSSLEAITHTESAKAAVKVNLAIPASIPLTIVAACALFQVLL